MNGAPVEPRQPDGCLSERLPREALIRTVHEEVLKRGGILRGDEYRFPCPAADRHRHGDADPSADWNQGKAVWICRACGTKGGVSDLATRLDIPLGLGPQGSSAARLQIFCAERGLLVERLRSVFGVEPVNWCRRPALRYRTAGGVDRIKFTDGRRPKYTWAKKGGKPHWYGLSVALGHLIPGGPLYIVNGEPSVWACDAAGVPAVCCCAGEGSPPTPDMLAKLQAALPMGGHPVRLCVVYDTDPAGRAGARRLADRLRAHFPQAQIQTLDLAGALRGIAKADVDDLHRRVGTELAVTLADLPPLLNESEHVPASSNTYRVNRDVPGGLGSLEPRDDRAALESLGVLGTPGSPEVPGSPETLEAPGAPGEQGRQARGIAIVGAATMFAREIKARGDDASRKLPFWLAQRLRAVEGAPGAEACDPDIILPAVTEFCAALAIEDPQGFGLEVLASWPKVRMPGADALAAAYRDTQDAPLELLSTACGLGDLFRSVVSMAYHLQRHRGEQSIHLPVTKLAAIFATSTSRISAALQMACTLGFLQLVDGTYSYRERRAKEYRFNFGCPLYRAPKESPTRLAARADGNSDAARNEKTPEIDASLTCAQCGARSHSFIGCDPLCLKCLLGCWSLGGTAP